MTDDADDCTHRRYDFLLERISGAPKGSRALQVCNKAGAWVDVPVEPDCCIVNLGELMARWTNDYWVSTLHRVVNPPQDLASESRRQSLVFFHNPNYNALIECIPSCQSAANPPKYPVTTSGEHLRSQFVRTQTQEGITY
jgi:isopenicillin N synthase-like dioxygenase